MNSKKICLIAAALLTLLFATNKTFSNPAMAPAALCIGPQAIACVAAAVVIGGTTYIIYNDDNVRIEFYTLKAYERFFKGVASVKIPGFEVIELGKTSDQPIGNYDRMNPEKVNPEIENVVEEEQSTEPERFLLRAKAHVISNPRIDAKFLIKDLGHQECLEFKEALLEITPSTIADLLRRFPRLEPINSNINRALKVNFISPRVRCYKASG